MATIRYRPLTILADVIEEIPVEEIPVSEVIEPVVNTDWFSWIKDFSILPKEGAFKNWWNKEVVYPFKMWTFGAVKKITIIAYYTLLLYCMFQIISYLFGNKKAGADCVKAIGWYVLLLFIDNLVCALIY